MPAIWLIDAYRAGERGQVRALAESLARLPGWTLRTLSLEYRTAVVWPHVFGTSSLSGITASTAAQLHAPWPDLVITCGVRNEPVCRWLRRQSSGQTRYVHVGRPWGPLHQFDLVITTPQYRVADAPNVLNNALTLHQLDASRLARAAATAQARYADLGGPYIAVNLGGNSGPFTLGPKAARRLAQQASALAESRGASLLISTSARTPAAAIDALAGSLTVPHSLYRWKPNDADNPYVGILGLASEIIVTADSIAMLSEACATGKPVHMFDLGGMRQEDPAAVEIDTRIAATLYGILLRFFWKRLSRDITLVHKMLQANGLAHWLCDRSSAGVACSELPRTVDAVQRLVGDTAAAVDVD